MSRGMTMGPVVGPRLFGQTDVAYYPEGEENGRGHTPLTGENLKRFCKSVNVPEEKVRRLVYVHDVHKLDSKSKEKAPGDAAQDSVEKVCNDFNFISERFARQLVELHDLNKINNELLKLEWILKHRIGRPATADALIFAKRLFNLGRDAHPHAQIHTDPLSEVRCKVYGPETSSTQIWESLEDVFKKDLDHVTLMVTEEKDGVTTWYANATASSSGLLLKTYTVETRASLLHIAQTKGLPIQQVSFDFLTAHASVSSGAYYGVEAGVNFVKADAGCFSATIGLDTGYGLGIKNDSLDLDVAGLEVTVGKVMGFSVFGTSISIDFGKLF